jgi:thiol-disulfide isomerase/thioredoxin
VTTAKKRPGKGSASKSTPKTTPKATAKVAAADEAAARRTRPVPVAAKKKRKFPVLPVVFGVVALALVAAIVFSPETEIGAEFGEVTVSGEELPVYISGQEDPAIGMTAPDIGGVGFDGTPVSIDNGDGTPKAIVFLAHWCPHCQAEVPRVQAWLDGGGGVEGVEIMSVSTSMNSGQENYPPSEWLEREGWTPPVIRDDTATSALTAYGSGGFPYWVFVDGEGNVVRRSGGELDVAVLEGYMQEIAPAA